MQSLRPKLPPKASLELIVRSALCPCASFEQVRLEHIDATGLEAKGMSIDEGVIEKVTLTGAQLEKLSLMDVELLACDTSAANCSDASLIRVQCIGGRMAGVDLNRSVLQDVVFEDCKLDMANFRFAKLTRVRFVNCMLTETDFQAAELTDVEFHNSHLEKVEFGQCKLKNADARTSQLFDIRGWQSLKGLIVDSTQLITIAPQLAQELGLIVKE